MSLTLQEVEEGLDSGQRTALHRAVRAIRALQADHPAQAIAIEEAISLARANPGWVVQNDSMGFTPFLEAINGGHLDLARVLFDIAPPDIRASGCLLWRARKWLDCGPAHHH